MDLKSIARHAQRNLDKLVTPKIEAFDEPSFAEGESGTLHGGTYEVDGYRFLQIVLFGSPKIKTQKGCTLTFKGMTSDFTVQSETREIESYYSESLQKGLTQFELFLDNDMRKEFRKGVKSISITFPKRFGKTTHVFDVVGGKFKKVVG